MKKKLSIIIICMFFFTSIIPVNAADINYSNGVQNTSQINVSFNGTQFNSSEKAAIKAAADTWTRTGQDLGTTRVPYYYNSSTYNTSNGISFKKANISGNVIANCAYNPVNSTTLKSSHITFSTNSSYNWTTNINNAQYHTWDVQSIALHEIGHSLGIGHLTNREAVMYPSANNSGERIITVHDEYVFYQIYNKLIVNSINSFNNELSNEINLNEYWISKGVITEDNVNYLDLRNVPTEYKNEKEKQYDYEIAMDILYVPLDDNQMINQSDLIIKGHVKEILSSWWNTSDGEAPLPENILEYSLFHDVVIEIDELYKGELTGRTKEIIVRQVGGTTDNVRQITSQIPYYTGEEVILY